MKFSVIFPKQCCDSIILQGKYPSFMAAMDSWAVCLNSWAAQISRRVSRGRCPCLGQGIGTRWVLKPLLTAHHLKIHHERLMEWNCSCSEGLVCWGRKQYQPSQFWSPHKGLRRESEMKWTGSQGKYLSECRTRGFPPSWSSVLPLHLTHNFSVTHLCWNELHWVYLLVGLFIVTHLHSI